MMKTDINIAYLNNTQGGGGDANKIEDVEITSADGSIQIEKSFDETSKVVSFDVSTDNSSKNITSSDNSLIISETDNTVDLRAKKIISSDNSISVLETENNEIDIKTFKGDTRVYYVANAKEFLNVVSLLNNKISAEIYVTNTIDLANKGNGNTTGGFWDEKTKSYNFGNRLYNTYIYGYGKRQLITTGFKEGVVCDTITIKSHRLRFERISFLQSISDEDFATFTGTVRFSRYMFEVERKGGLAYFTNCFFPICGFDDQMFIRITNLSATEGWHLTIEFKQCVFQPLNKEVSLAQSKFRKSLMIYADSAENDLNLTFSQISYEGFKSGLGAVLFNFKSSKIFNISSDGSISYTTVSQKSNTQSLAFSSLNLYNLENDTNTASTANKLTLCTIDANGMLKKISVDTLKTILGIN